MHTYDKLTSYAGAVAGNHLSNKLAMLAAADVFLADWHESQPANPHPRPLNATSQLPGGLTLEQLWPGVPYQQRTGTVAHSDLMELVNILSLVHDAAILTGSAA